MPRAGDALSALPGLDRRQFIGAGALGLFASSALVRQALAAPSPRVVQYYGHIMQVMFETSVDLTALMPEGLRPVDPHRGFIKSERLKTRTPEADRQPASYSQYQQVCISTLAEAPGFGQRHRNALVWVDRPERMVGTSMGKRYSEIEMTHIYEQDRAALSRGEAVPFHIDVQAYGYHSLNFTGMLDGTPRAPAPPYGGFYVGGEPGVELKALTLDDFALSRPLYGTGDLTFGGQPNEDATVLSPAGLWPASLLGKVKVVGCVFQELAFTRTYGTEFRTVR